MDEPIALVIFETSKGDRLVMVSWWLGRCATVVPISGSTSRQTVRGFDVLEMKQNYGFCISPEWEYSHGRNAKLRQPQAPSVGLDQEFGGAVRRASPKRGLQYGNEDLRHGSSTRPPGKVRDEYKGRGWSRLAAGLRQLVNPMRPSGIFALTLHGGAISMGVTQHTVRS